jgi:hypothetical protein
MNDKLHIWSSKNILISYQNLPETVNLLKEWGSLFIFKAGYIFYTKRFPLSTVCQSPL